MSLHDLLRLPARKAREFTFAFWGMPVGNEEAYHRLFARRLGELGIVDDFRPVGAAASSSLLYLMLEIVVSGRPNSIVEFGSGETTRLLERLKCMGLLPSYVSYEESDQWAARAEREGVRGVEHAELSVQRHRGYEASFYPISLMKFEAEIFLVDGPLGERSRGRLLSAPLLAEMVPHDHVVVFDDVNRADEAFTADLFERLCRCRQIENVRRVLRGRTWQTVFLGGRYRELVL